MSDPELHQPEPETAPVPQQPRQHSRTGMYLIAAGVVVAAAAGALVVFLLLHKGDQSWKPDPALLGELGEEVEVGDYRIRPPRGYKRLPAASAQGRPGDRVYMWLGPARADGAIPRMRVLLLTPPPGEADTDLEDILEKFLKGAREHWRAWIQEPVETGRVNGLKFLRTRWSGINIATGQPTRGFLYLARDGDIVIQISSQDVEPDHEQPLRLAETAALTFKKP